MKKIIVILLFFTLNIFLVNSLQAASAKDQFNSGVQTTAGFSGYNTSADNPETVFTTKIASIIKTLLSLVGIIFLLLMIYGGYRWMTARGNDSEVTTAKNIIINASIGLIIIMAAYAITALVGTTVETINQPAPVPTNNP